MTEILEKNLSFIKSYNSRLLEKIENATTSKKNIELNTNLLGEYNLIIDGMAVHSVSGAQEEAKQLVARLPHDTDNSIHIVYGLGLGYYFDELIQNAKGSIIVIEPDIEVLKFVLSIVDFSENFSKKKSFIVSDVDELQSIFEQVFRYKSKVSLTALPYYSIHCADSYSDIKSKVERMTVLIGHNFSFQVHEILSFFLYTIKELEKKYHCPLITDYKDLLKNKPAIIVSAGPSLASNIDKLKKYKDNAFIFCVGTAYRTLIDNGIIPDFLNIIERVDTKFHYKSDYLKDSILVCEPYTNANIFENNYKQILITPSVETDASRWFIEKTGRNVDDFETKGTVSYHALYTAKYLGCNPIILIGQDLAYSDGNCYAKGSLYDDLCCEFDENLHEYKIYPKNFDRFRDSYYASLTVPDETKTKMLVSHLKKINAELVTVDGQSGNKLPTSNAYALFIDYIKSFAQRFGDELTLINSSIGGAQIDGFTVMDIEDACLKYASFPLHKNDLIDSVDFSSQYDISYIISSISDDLKALAQIFPLVSKGVKLVEQLKKELARSKGVSDNAANLLKKLSSLYVDITNNYTNKTRMLRMVALKNHSNLSFLMKEYKGQMNDKIFADFFDAFNSYYSDLAKYSEILQQRLTASLERLKEINESCNSKG